MNEISLRLFTGSYVINEDGSVAISNLVDANGTTIPGSESTDFIKITFITNGAVVVSLSGVNFVPVVEE